jgi:hypothetical protein
MKKKTLKMLKEMSELLPKTEKANPYKALKKWYNSLSTEEKFKFNQDIKNE